MPFVTWTPQLSVGVQALDNDHKLMVSLINQLNDAVEDGQGKETVASVFNALYDYTEYHFEREEMLMRVCGYPDLESHRKIHDALRIKVKKIHDDYAKSENKDLSKDVLNFMKNWLTEHIQGRDKLYQHSMEGKNQEIEAANRAYLDELEKELSESCPARSPAMPKDRHTLILRRNVGSVTTLTLNRPDKFNAINLDMIGALETALGEIAVDDTCRVMILAGAGKNFCTGHDLKELEDLAAAEDDPENGKAAVKNVFDRCAGAIMGLTRMPQPVIAKVQGVATAAGCQLVAAADLAVAERGARFATSGVNLGLFCSTPMIPLSRAIGRKGAMEMLLTGDFISAERALGLGLINAVAEAGQLDETVRTLAEKIAAKSRQAVTMGKELFYRQIERDMEKAYELATEVMACNMMTGDARGAIAAFASKKNRHKK
jgi:hemerythrin-like metal-binding protein